jgi:hypothetical protein
VQLDVVLFRGGLNALPRCIALGVADVFHLVEASHGIAHVAGICQGLLALLFERELGGGQVVAVGLVELGCRLSQRAWWPEIIETSTPEARARASRSERVTNRKQDGG